MPQAEGECLAVSRRYAAASPSVAARQLAPADHIEWSAESESARPLPLAEHGRGDADGLLVRAEVEGAGEA